MPRKEFTKGHLLQYLRNQNKGLWTGVPDNYVVSVEISGTKINLDKNDKIILESRNLADKD